MSIYRNIAAIFQFSVFDTIWGERKHAPKRSAQNINNSLTNLSVKSVRSNDTKDDKDEEKEVNVSEMFEIIMNKLSKLDIIDNRVKSIEKDLTEVIKKLRRVRSRRGTGT